MSINCLNSLDVFLSRISIESFGIQMMTLKITRRRSARAILKTAEISMLSRVLIKSASEAWTTRYIRLFTIASAKSRALSMAEYYSSLLSFVVNSPSRRTRRGSEFIKRYTRPIFHQRFLLYGQPMLLSDATNNNNVP